MILNLLVGCFGTLAVSLKHDYIDHDANHDDKHVFGERGWGTKACEDIASAYWNQEPSVSGDRWYVKTRGVRMNAVVAPLVALEQVRNIKSNTICQAWTTAQRDSSVKFSKTRSIAMRFRKKIRMASRTKEQ